MWRQDKLGNCGSHIRAPNAILCAQCRFPALSADSPLSVQIPRSQRRFPALSEDSPLSAQTSRAQCRFPALGAHTPRCYEGDTQICLTCRALLKSVCFLVSDLLWSVCDYETRRDHWWDYVDQAVLISLNPPECGVGLLYPAPTSLRSR